MIRFVRDGPYVIEFFHGIKIVVLPRFEAFKTERLGYFAQWTQEEGHAVQKYWMLDIHAYNF